MTYRLRDPADRPDSIPLALGNGARADTPRVGPDCAVRVAATTAPHKLAETVLRLLLRDDACDVMAMGPMAISNAVTGIALGSGLLAARALGVSLRVYLTSTPGLNGDHARHGVLFRLTRTPIST